jgi:hypothetical protein
MQEKRTFPEHLDYLVKIVQLKLWFVGHWLRGHPQEDVAFVLRQRVDIYRKTVFWQGQGFPTEADFNLSGWLAVERQVRSVYRQANDGTDRSAFEKRAFEVVWPVVEANARRDYEVSLAGKGFRCDSLEYDPPSLEHPGRVHFHIANALQPRSIFEDRAYLPGCFFCLMDRAEAEHGADCLGTGSWLNSYPRWLVLFPREYLDNMEPETEDVWCGLGHWGQFLTARGTFHEARAARFRETGWMPYPGRYAWCSFAAMRRHLQDHLEGEGLCGIRDRRGGQMEATASGQQSPL